MGLNEKFFASATSEPVDPDLDLFLDASNSNSYSGSGNIWYDLTDNSNDANLINSPTFESSGGYFDFNGTSQSATADSDLTGQEYSASIWMNPDLKTGCIFEVGAVNGLSTNNNKIFFSGPKLYASMNGADAGFAQTAATNFGAGIWNMITVVYTNSQIKIYNNKSFLASASTSGVFESLAQYRIGVDHHNGDNRQYFNGKIAKVSVFDKALSVAEINALHTAGR